MDIEDLKNSLDILTETLRRMPQSIREIVRPANPGDPGIKEYSGSVAGGMVGRLTDYFSGISPQFRTLGRELSNLVDTIKEKDSILSTIGKFKSFVPSTREELKEAAKAVSGPFVREKDREKVVKNIAKAGIAFEERDKAASNRDKAIEIAKDAREVHVKSIDQYNEAVKRKDRLDVQTARAFKARDSFSRQYFSLLRLHQGYTGQGASPYLVHLKAVKKREEQAKKFAQGLAKKARKASANVVNARSNVSSAAKASRAAMANARSSASQASTRFSQARKAASAVASSVVAANVASKFVAISSAIGTAITVVDKLIGTFIDLRGVMERFSETTLAANRKSSMYSVQTARAFQQLYMQDISRNMGFAGATSDTATRLIESINKMRNDQLQLRTSSQNISNTFAGLTARFVGGFDSNIGSLMAQIDRLIEGMGVGNGGDIASMIGSAISRAIVGVWPEVLGLVGDFFGFAKAKDPNDFRGHAGQADKFVEMIAQEHWRGAGAPRGRRPGAGDGNPFPGRNVP